MKALLKIFGTALFAILLFGCSKSSVTISQEDQMVKYLTGDAGNRVWRISKIYENSVEKQLTIDQMSYTKTYTIGIPPPAHSGSFTDSDGYKGKWVLTSALLIETITNNASGDVSIQYRINSLAEHAMDVEYTLNGKTMRIVYYAL